MKHIFGSLITQTFEFSL